ncbi:protoporphyrinogen oxidase [Arthrobacter sp. YD4]|uniref:protoporphyrinogen oxidase n=1 Tax=Arthrobacter sp. YD4 TaxID=3058043 RepID=UPI0025B2B169|nr:protoporphyrinogen oxidase [Arthrobacter sp. YD4]MDN3934773.1 protoporphyrinogen oxidase [Arthrobacter sp. YD4]
MAPDDAPATAAPTAVVVGGGISGLLAARQLAGAGVRTTVLEATGTWGGCVGSHVVAGLTLDSGAESFATRSDAVAALARELGLGPQIAAPNPGGAWVQLPEGPRELPKTGVLGIPANPWDPEVRRTLGLGGSLRAWVDTLLPASVGTGGAATSVAALVRARMGRRVLDRLVSPVVGGVHSADPALLDVDMVAPGLRAGLRAHGSLAAAVKAQRRASTTASPAAPQESTALQESTAPQESTASQGSAVLQKAGSAVAGLRGGMHTLVTALLAELTDLGVTLRAGTPAAAVRRTPTGWQVTAGGEEYDAGRLVVAVEGPAAVGLLSGVLPEITALRPEAGPDVKLVTLVLDRSELDAAPRGTGVLVAPQSPGIQAKALTHATAKWAWLDESTAPGRHVLRLSYGRGATPGAPVSATAGAMPEPDTEADLLAAALRDASTLLGVGLSRDDLAGWDVVRWAGALPFASLGHKQRVARVRELCAAEGDLAVVGGWVAGNGLAAIVADTPRQIAPLLPAVARDSAP